MKNRMMSGWVLGLFVFWFSCTGTEKKISKPSNAQRHADAFHSVFQALYLQKNFSFPTAGRSIESKTEEGPTSAVVEKGEGKDGMAFAQRLNVFGSVRFIQTAIRDLSTNKAPLLGVFGVQRRAQTLTPPCPRRVGDTVVLEEVYVLDKETSKSGTATLIFGPNGVKAEIKWDDGQTLSLDLDLDLHSPFKGSNYAKALQEICDADIPDVTDEALKKTEAQNALAVSNSRIFGQISIYAKTTGRGQQASTLDRSGEVIISKSKQRNTIRGEKEFEDGFGTDQFETLAVLLSTASTKPGDKSLSFRYIRVQKKLDCVKKTDSSEKTDPTEQTAPSEKTEPVEKSDPVEKIVSSEVVDRTDGGMSEATPKETLIESKAPDQSLDCSPYLYKKDGKVLYSWFAGTDKGAVCAVMYDKVYGRNGQDLLCKTDADCRNPCRLLCCRGIFFEQVVCKGGTCTFAISNKCGFCGTLEGPPCTLPPEHQKP